LYPPRFNGAFLFAPTPPDFAVTSWYRMSTDLPEQSAAQRESQRMFGEASSLLGRNLPLPVFIGELLPRLLHSVSAVAGAVWQWGPHGLQPLCLAGWERTGLEDDSAAAERHAQALAQYGADQAEAVLVPSTGEGAANGSPIPWAIFLAPIRIEAHPWGLLEVILPTEASQDDRHGPWPHMRAYAALTTSYLLERRLAEAAAVESRGTQWERFATEVGKRLDLKYVATAVANESRRLAGCDRASVAVRRGSKMRLLGASGLDEINQRAATVAALRRLAQAVCKSGEPLYVDHEPAELPAEIDIRLKDCLELTHAKTVVVWPFSRPIDRPADQMDRPPPKPEPPIAALILEQITAEAPARQLAARLGPTTRLSAMALANALAHDNIFLLPVWRAVGQALSWLRVHPVRKLAAILGGLALVLGILFLYPAELEVEGPGTLQPVQRRDVFAEIDGEIIEVQARHDQRVESGQVLAVMRNVELEIQRISLQGERSSTQERILAIESSLFARDDDTDDRERQRLHGERAGLQTTLANLDRQIALLDAKRALLEVKSPLAGTVLTWNVRETLLFRPVKRGDALLTVADTAGPWELRVQLPEDRSGILADAQRAAAGQPLAVRFVAANQPTQSFEGRLREVHNRAESTPAGKNAVLLAIDIDRDQLVDPRAGAEVTARVQCGQRSLGYVLFHDAWAFLRTKILFRWF
jgi:multidrug efflux pump subunit AcrA (membrane-fusion protein)